MHGRLKVYTSEEQKLKKQKEQQKQVIAYRQSFKTILASRKPDGYDTESLEICSKILIRQPDVYTLWNYRKEAVLLKLSKGASDSGDSGALVDFLQNELQLTQQCLMSNSKSYSAWHHRYWILERHPNPDWKKEFSLCGQYLALDARNFHCWDYRRLVLNKVGISLLDEIDFSTERIYENFSNYSSWHYRSTLKFLDDATLPDELMIIENAIYTDPYDSSTWFYLKYVLGNHNLTSERQQQLLKTLNELSELEANCKWVLIAKCWLITEQEGKDECYKKLAKLDVLREGRYLTN